MPVFYYYNSLAIIVNSISTLGLDFVLKKFYFFVMIVYVFLSKYTCRESTAADIFLLNIDEKNNLYGIKQYKFFNSR
jgi:hypothetical protein